MQPTAKSDGIVRFGAFEIDASSGELRKSGLRLRLQGQPLQILLLLVHSPGEVVTREQLRERLWANDTFVDFEHSLNTAVKKLRQTLGDDPNTPRFIETVPRKGYRFIAAVDRPIFPTNSLTSEQPSNRYRRRKWAALLSLTLLPVGIAILWLLEREASLAPQLFQHRLTANPPDDPVVAAVISPDGKYLAFRDSNGFRLQEVETGETHPWPIPKGLDAEPASWFPNGSHIVVTSLQAGGDAPELWSVPLFGGALHKLSDRGWAPSVSPDGSHIVYLSGPAHVQSRSAGDEIWSMLANGGEQRILVRTDSGFCSSPVWSPDGKEIAFLFVSRWSSDQMQVQNLDLATGRRRTILAYPYRFTLDLRGGQGIGAALAWAPDGRLIYSVPEASPNQDQSNLWGVKIDSKTGEAISRPARITREPENAAVVSLSRDGRRLAFLKHGLQPDVYIADVSSGTIVGRPRRLTLDERQDYPFSWMPDGKQVLFVSDRTGHFNIYKQAIDETEPELLAGGELDLNIPRITSDGKTVIYLAFPKQRAASVRVMRVSTSGGPPREILAKPEIGNIACAVYGSKICIYNQVLPGKTKYFRFDPDTNLQQELPEAESDDLHCTGFALSPDGSTLALDRSDCQNGTSLKFVSLVGAPQRTVALKPSVRLASLDWAADGRSFWAVANVSTPDGTLLNIDLEGNVQTLLQVKQTKLGWAIPSPDGRHLALWEASGSSNVWMLQDF